MGLHQAPIACHKGGLAPKTDCQKLSAYDLARPARQLGSFWRRNCDKIRNVDKEISGATGLTAIRRLDGYTQAAAFSAIDRKNQKELND